MVFVFWMILLYYFNTIISCLSRSLTKAAYRISKNTTTTNFNQQNNQIQYNRNKRQSNDPAGGCVNHFLKYQNAVMKNVVAMLISDNEISEMYLFILNFTPPFPGLQTHSEREWEEEKKIRILFFSSPACCGLPQFCNQCS